MKTTQFLALLLFTTFALMGVALYNGFPLAEGDTGAYIEQAIYPHFAPDRTPFYGIFLRVTSLWTSLWFPVFVQCLLLAFVLLRYIQVFIKRQTQFPDQPNQNGSLRPTLIIPAINTQFLLIIFCIVSLTCVSWVSSYLMPDIFTGILLVTLLLFINMESGNKTSRTLYSLIILSSIAIHFSHFLITLLFSIALFLYALKNKQKLLVKKCMWLMGFCIVIWVTLCSMNAAKKNGFTFSRGTNIFLVAKLAETGILNTYLDENCSQKNLRLCEYKNQVPAGLSEFLWMDYSPLNKMGGWDSCKTEYASVVHDVFTTPRYLLMFARKSAISTLKQLVQVQVRDKIQSEGKEKQPWKKVRQYFADELREFDQAKQNNDELSSTACNPVYLLFFVLTTIWVLVWGRQAVNKEVAFIYGCILAFMFINALVTATFSTVSYRYQYRIFWLLPATNLIVMVKYYFREQGKEGV